MSSFAQQLEMRPFLACTYGFGVMSGVLTGGRSAGCKCIGVFDGIGISVTIGVFVVIEFAVLAARVARKFVSSRVDVAIKNPEIIPPAIIASNNSTTIIPNCVRKARNNRTVHGSAASRCRSRSAASSWAISRAACACSSAQCSATLADGVALASSMGGCVVAGSIRDSLIPTYPRPGCSFGRAASLLPSQLVTASCTICQRSFCR